MTKEKSAIVSHSNKSSVLGRRRACIVMLAASGVPPSAIAKTVGLQANTVRNMIQRPGWSAEIARVQDVMRQQLAGKGVKVGLQALDVISKALRDDSSSLMARAKLALKLIEAQAKAHTGPNVAVNTQVNVSAADVLRRLEGKAPTELSDDELELVSRSDVVDAQFDQ